MKTNILHPSAIVLCAIYMFSVKALGFEVITHAEITKHAVGRSIIAGQEFLDQIGLNRGKVFQQPHSRECLIDVAHYPLGQQALETSVYFHGTQFEKPYCRWITSWDRINIIAFSVNPGSPLTWIQVGAVREDDVVLVTPDSDWQDPNPFAVRVLNHFFDPFNNIPLTVPAPLLARKSPAWALGLEDINGARQAPDKLTSSHFSVIDVHDAMFRAVTGHKMDRDGNLIPVATSSQSIRNDWWATTFRGVGDLVHLIQDMGQPQHTRNDKHAGILDTSVGGHASVFEAYVEARATYNKEKAIDEECGAAPISGLKFDGYPIPKFRNYLDYWTTSIGSQRNSGRGFADYTNRGFFTAGTNIDSKAGEALPLPTRDFRAFIYAPIPSPTGCGIDGNVSMLFGSVKDDFEPAETKLCNATDAKSCVPMSTCSLWTPAICESSPSKQFSLNRSIYDAQANLVIPRAVAYSSGLINHVFRGKLQIEPPPERLYAIVDHSVESGFRKLVVELTNTTADISSAEGEVFHQNMVDGHLVAVARFHKNKCYTNDLSGEYGVGTPGNSDADVARCRNGGKDITDLNQEIVVSKPIKLFSLLHGERKRVTLDFSDNPIPFSATDLYLQIVYRGRLGAEDDAVVVAGKDLAEPIYSVFFNSSDHVRVAGKNYTRTEFAANIDNVLEKVRADWPGCVSNTVPPVLATSCFQEIPFSVVTMKFGAVTSPNVEIRNIPPRRFTRIAYLGDANIGSVINKIEGDVLTYWYRFKLQNAQWATTTEGAPSRETYQVKQMIDARGLKTNDDLTYILQSGRNPPPPPERPIDSVPFRNLTDRTKKSDSDYTPFPATITFPIPEGGSPLSFDLQNSTRPRQSGVEAAIAR